VTHNIKRRKQEKGKLLAAPPAAPEPSPEQLHPLFGLRHLPRENLNSCGRDDQAAFANTLSKLSQLTWAQIRTIDKYKLGFETIPRQQLNIPLPPPVTDEVRILVFRYSGMKAMIGYREKATFFPIWLDHNFSAYDHGS
jgi:hypothetical protein